MFNLFGKKKEEGAREFSYKLDGADIGKLKGKEIEDWINILKGEMEQRILDGKRIPGEALYEIKKEYVGLKRGISFEDRVLAPLYAALWTSDFSVKVGIPHNALNVAFLGGLSKEDLSLENREKVRMFEEAAERFRRRVESVCEEHGIEVEVFMKYLDSGA